MWAIPGAILTVAAILSPPMEGLPGGDPGNTGLSKSQVESGPWTSDPWPELDRVGRIEAEALVVESLESMEGHANAGGNPAKPIRTRFLLVHGERSRNELLHAGTVLDRAVQRMNTLMEEEADHAPFAGRLGLHMSGNRDRFMMLLAGRLNIYAATGSEVHLHVSGRRTILVANGDAEPALLNHQLHRAAAHAYLHALHSPNRLPAWANEGLATAIAWGGSGIEDRVDRSEAIAMVREGSMLEELIEMQYADGSWHGDRMTEARAGLLMERALLARPHELREWILSVKKGVEWRKAFKSAFNDSPEAMARWAGQYFTVND